MRFTATGMAFLCYFTSRIGQRAECQLMMTVKSHSLSANRQSKIRRTNLRFCALAAMFLLFAACDVELRKADTQLGLNPQQAAGRHIFDERCERCHSAYSSRGKKGPSMKGVFKRPFLSKSGLPANDQQVGDIIRYGRNVMPGYSQVLNCQQMSDLLAYLHTL
jgi:mono/diheme cytochrome c family protein